MRSGPAVGQRMGESALHLVCSKGNAEITALLLKHGAVVYRVSHRGLPLHIACHFGHATIVAALLSVPNRNRRWTQETALYKGMTAWEYAHLEGHESCCALLPAATVPVAGAVPAVDATPTTPETMTKARSR